jgi:putative oxidoreductase
MRIVVGLLFACNGGRKLFGIFGGMRATGEAAPFFSQMGLAGIIELFGGLMIAAGLLTGYAAFIASGEMAVAYFQSHFPRDFWPILNRGERAVFYSFIFLYMASRGAVVWGIDSLLRRPKGSP